MEMEYYLKETPEIEYSDIDTPVDITFVNSEGQELSVSVNNKALKDAMMYRILPLDGSAIPANKFPSLVKSLVTDYTQDYVRVPRQTNEPQLPVFAKLDDVHFHSTLAYFKEIYSTEVKKEKLELFLSIFLDHINIVHHSGEDFFTLDLRNKKVFIKKAIRQRLRAIKNEQAKETASYWRSEYAKMAYDLRGLVVAVVGQFDQYRKLNAEELLAYIGQEKSVLNMALENICFKFKYSEVAPMPIQVNINQQSSINFQGAIYNSFSNKANLTSLEGLLLTT